MAGKTLNTTNSTSDIFIVKINTAGDTLWSKSIDMGNSEEAYSVQQTFDKGFIISGYVNNNPAPYTLLAVVKLDSIGNLSWAKKITCGNYENLAYSIKEMPDSGYVLIGYIENKIGSAFYPGTCMLRLSSNGTIFWAKEYNPSTSNYTTGNDVIVTSDGLLSYLSGSNGGVVIMKSDFSGNILWSKEYVVFFGNIGGYPMPKLYPTKDKGLVFVTASSPGSPGNIQKIDTLGNILWSQQMFLATTDIIESNDKGFLVLGNGPLLGVKMAPTFNPQIGLITTDSVGNSTACVSSNTLSSNTYTLTTTALTYTSATGNSIYNKHPLISNASLSVDSGCVAMTGGMEDIKDRNALSVYPNPAYDFIVIENPNTNVLQYDVSIKDIEGREVLNEKIKLASAHSVSICDLSNGIYILTLQNEKENYVKKIIIQK